MIDPIESLITGEHDRQRAAWNDRLATTLWALRVARVYVLEHLEVQPNEESASHLALIDEAIANETAQVGRNPKGRNREDGFGAKHEHAVGNADAPKD